MKKNLNFYKKSAFTMTEVIMVIIAISSIMYGFVQWKSKNDFYNSINSFLNKSDLIVEKAIMNPINGYINGNSGYCSDDSTYKGLTTGRAIKCIKWDNNFKISKASNNSNNVSPKNEFVYGLLKDYTNNEGCKIYAKANNSNLKEYFLFFDCSNISYGNIDRNKKLIEAKIRFNITDKFPTLYKNIYVNMKDIDHTTGGNDSDGKIGFLMKN